MAEKKTLDLLKESFDLSKRRKFDVKDDNGKTVVSLYFKAITRADRARATQRAGSDDPLIVSTHMLCQLAENEDGTKAFASSDAENLKRFLPETVLNDLEIFMMDIQVNVDIAKKE